MKFMQTKLMRITYFYDTVTTRRGITIRTLYMYSPGAIIISCLLVLTLRKERSLVGSRSLTVERALVVSCWTRLAY